MRPSYGAACAGVKRSRTFALVNPTLESGALLLLVGVLLGPALGILDGPTLRALSPATAFGIAWIGAGFGTRLDWDAWRRLPRRAWAGHAGRAAVILGATGLTGWLLARTLPALAAAWQPLRAALLVISSTALDGLFGAGAFALTLAAYHPRASFPGGFGWLGWLAVAGAAGAGVGLLFEWLSRLRTDARAFDADLFGVILVGAGVGYAVEVSPFLICVLATAWIVNRSPGERQRLQAVWRAWERPVFAALLLLTGALLEFPTPWLVPAALLLGVVSVAARWATARVAPPPLPGTEGGAVALALGLSFGLVYDSGGAVLLTVLLLLGPRLALAFRRPPGEVTA